MQYPRHDDGYILAIVSESGVSQGSIRLLYSAHAHVHCKELKHASSPGQPAGQNALDLSTPYSLRQYSAASRSLAEQGIYKIEQGEFTANPGRRSCFHSPFPSSADDERRGTVKGRLRPYCAAYRHRRPDITSSFILGHGLSPDLAISGYNQPLLGDLQGGHLNLMLPTYNILRSLLGAI